MAQVKTGWKKPLPSADGDYFSRVDEYDKWPTLIRIETGAVYEMGQGGNLVREYAAEDYEYLGPFTAADFEQLVRLREEVVTLRVDQQAVRKLYDLPDEGDFYEQMADHLEYDTVDRVRLQNAVWNLLTETFYDQGLKNNGVAVKFLMRLHLLACEAGLPEYSKDNPVVAEAIAALGDPAENSAESLAAAALRHALGTREGE